MSDYTTYDVESQISGKKFFQQEKIGYLCVKIAVVSGVSEAKT